MSAIPGAKTTRARFVRSSLLLVASVLLVAAVIAPWAYGKSGSAGWAGLSLAALICLVSSWIAEGLAVILHGRVMPLVTLLIGMAIRTVPPLAVCVVIMAQGATGPQHLAFIVYLLAFYFVTLALDTWLTVDRIASLSAPTKSRAV